MSFGKNWGSGNRCKPVVRHHDGKHHDCKEHDRKHHDCKEHDHKHDDSCCGSCGSKHSHCVCKFRSPEMKKVELNSDCVLVNSVVCSKMVQKVAQAIIPLAALGITPVPGTPLPLITVTVDTAGIVQNATILRDKVVNMGTVPVTISVAGAVGLPFTLQFQEHTDCPGACPEDTLIETPLQVEGTLVQPILGATIAGLVDVDVAVVKVILRTTITVVRPLIAKTNHHAFDCLQDVNPDRCETPTIPTTVTFPTTTPPAGGGGGV